MFYKKDGDMLLAGGTINSPVVTLKVEDKDSFEYPQDGWYWFDTEDEAYSFFGIRKEI